MAKLTVSFAGLELRNPFIVASSGLTGKASNNRIFEQAGAGAVVLKSIFEEQIVRRTAAVARDGDRHPEADAYVESYLRSDYLRRYLDLLGETRLHSAIPIVASINCYRPGEWVDYARLVCARGVDAIELNIFSLPSSSNYVYGAFEQRHAEIVREVVGAVEVPVIVKLGRNLTNPVALIDRLRAEGVSGVVLFNRMWMPDIDIVRMRTTVGEVFSGPGDLCETLRWTALASAGVPATDFAASGGIGDGDALVKALLAGASAVEVCSALYRRGPEVIGEMLGRLEAWMDEKGYLTIDEFRGALDARKEGVGETYHRTQFLRYYGSLESPEFGPTL